MRPRKEVTLQFQHFWKPSCWITCFTNTLGRLWHFCCIFCLFGVCLFGAIFFVWLDFCLVLFLFSLRESQGRQKFCLSSSTRPGNRQLVYKQETTVLLGCRNLRAVSTLLMIVLSSLKTSPWTILFKSIIEWLWIQTCLLWKTTSTIKFQ